MIGRRALVKNFYPSHEPFFSGASNCQLCPAGLYQSSAGEYFAIVLSRNMPVAVTLPIEQNKLLVLLMQVPLSAQSAILELTVYRVCARVLRGIGWKRPQF